MAKLDKRKRLYYPYCGYKRGFCLFNKKIAGCIFSYDSYAGSCRYWRAKHPITGLTPQSLEAI